MDYQKTIRELSTLYFISNLGFTYIGWLLVNIKHEVFILYYPYGFIPFYIHVLGHKQIIKHWFKQHTGYHHIRMYPYKYFDDICEYKSEVAWYINGNVLYMQ